MSSCGLDQESDDQHRQHLTERNEDILREEDHRKSVCVVSKSQTLSGIIRLEEIKSNNSYNSWAYFLNCDNARLVGRIGEHGVLL